MIRYGAQLGPLIVFSDQITVSPSRAERFISYSSGYYCSESSYSKPNAKANSPKRLGSSRAVLDWDQSNDALDAQPGSFEPKQLTIQGIQNSGTRGAEVPG